MNGEENSNKSLDQVLDEYEKSTGLNLKVNLDEIEIYLNLTREQMEGYTSEGCAQIALRLIQYSLLIQKWYNREKAKINWAEHQIDAMVATKWKNYSDYTPRGVKIQNIAHENPMLQKILEIKKQASIRAQELDSLSYLIKYYAETMNMLGRAKWQNKI